MQKGTIQTMEMELMRIESGQRVAREQWFEMQMDVYLIITAVVYEKDGRAVARDSKR